MDIFPHITYECSSDSEDAEWKERDKDRSAQTRCADVTSAELDELEKSRNEANTVRQTTWALNCLQTWLDLKNIQVNFQQVKKTDLNTVLREFYGSIRTTKGELYSISSYLGLRAGLNRYLNEPPVSRSWNLMQDPEFIPANKVFKGVVKEIRRTGREKTKHYPPISPEDQCILKYSAALSPDSPRGLLNKVWYDVQLHFGRRGKEGNRDLKPDSFILKCDDNGAKYFTMTLNDETKNPKDPLERDRGNTRGAMYEERGNALCPVASLEKYLQKIPPDAKALYLQPRRATEATDRFWYTAVPLGVNQLSQMLPRMCKEAGTHTSYTNHSMRATAIQKLSDAGLEARKIMAVNGYRFKRKRRSDETNSRHPDHGDQSTPTSPTPNYDGMEPGGDFCTDPPSALCDESDPEWTPSENMSGNEMHEATTSRGGTQRCETKRHSSEKISEQVAASALLGLGDAAHEDAEENTKEHTKSVNVQTDLTCESVTAMQMEIKRLISENKTLRMQIAALKLKDFEFEFS